jgi:hypothetical protein
VTDRAFPEMVREAPSEAFIGAVVHSGSMVINCEFCGRVHFGNGLGMDGGELQALLTKAKAQPEKYHQHADVDMVSWGSIDGKQFVADCPCNGARRLEDFIWQHRRLIASYLAARSRAQLDAAKRDKEIAERAVAAASAAREPQ